VSWRSITLLPAFIAVVVLFYIVLGSADNRWADASLRVALNYTFFLHIYCYLLQLRDSTRPKLVINLLFSGLLLLFLIGGAMDCGLNRGHYGNCGEENLLLLALLNFAIILILDDPKWPQVSAIFASTIFVVFASIGPYLTAPLKADLDAANLTTSCYFQYPTYYRQSEVTRITSADQLRLSWAIGEHSPRVFKKEGDTIQVWRYATREFDVYSHRAEYGKADQTLDFAKLCAP